jgi:hypothetical protein
MTNLNDLDDDRLEQVTGGMSCGAALSLAKFHISFGLVLVALGDTEGGRISGGRAQGLIEGACPK